MALRDESCQTFGSTMSTNDDEKAPSEEASTPLSYSDGSEASEQDEDANSNAAETTDDRRPSEETLALRQHAVSFVLETEDTSSSTNKKDYAEKQELSIDIESQEGAATTGVSAAELVHDDGLNKQTPSAKDDDGKQRSHVPGAVAVGAEEEKVDEGAESLPPVPLLRTQTEIMASVPPPLERGGGAGASAPGAFRMRGTVATRPSGSSDRTVSPDGETQASGNDESNDVNGSDRLVDAELVEENGEQPVASPLTRESSKVIEATPMEDMSPLSAMRQLLKHRSVRIVLFILVVVFIGAIVGLVVGLTGGGSGGDDDDEPEQPSNDMAPTMPPDGGDGGGGGPGGEFETPLAMLISAGLKPRSLQAMITNDDSPQAKALRWLRASPMLESFSDARRLQRFALATLYYETRGELWLSSGLWLSDQHECDWFSTAVEPVCVDDNYTRLELNTNELDGRLANTDLYLLSSLEVLDVINNALHGPIPSWTGDLTNLKRYMLGENFMSGSISRSLSSLAMLKVLDLQVNLFSDDIPSVLGLLSLLQDIDITGTDLSGQIPSELGMLSALQFLSASDTLLTGTLPTEFSNMTSLIYMDFDFTSVAGALPSEYGELANLETLYLDDTLLSGNLPTEWGGMTSLFELTVKNGFLDGSIPSELGLCTALGTLVLANNTLTGTIATELGNLGELFLLSLSQNNLNGTLATELGRLSNLEDLWAFSNHFEGAMPSELGLLTTLFSIDLEDNNLGGVMPDEICALTELEFFEELLVDCELFECACCTGCPIV